MVEKNIVNFSGIEKVLSHLHTLVKMCIKKSLGLYYGLYGMHTFLYTHARTHTHTNEHFIMLNKILHSFKNFPAIVFSDGITYGRFQTNS